MPSIDVDCAANDDWKIEVSSKKATVVLETAIWKMAMIESNVILDEGLAELVFQ